MWLVELIAEIDGETIQRTYSKDHILIGRAVSNDFFLHDPRVSSLHGQLVFRDGRYFYQDLQSTNGSMVEVDGEQFVVDGIKFKEREIRDGDSLLLGDIQSPTRIHVRLFEGEAEGESKDESGKTILASRAISDFSLLSQQILDDKSLVRSLFRFQKEIHERDKAQDIYQHVALFLLNHVPNAEYVALHREETTIDSKWRQVYFTSKTKDISADLTRADVWFDEGWTQRRALLLDAEQIVGLRVAGQAAKPLRTMILSPLIQQERVIGFVEIGNTSHSIALNEHDLDLVSLITYVFSARVVNLRLIEVVREAEEKLKNENVYLKSMIRQTEDDRRLIGNSNAMQSVRRQIETVGPSELTVMILGDTGTGKEVVAQSIHKQSKRSGAIFAAVNCGTFSDTLLESELFGHVKGAFTGAIDNKKGLFEVADGGTLFLDEIGETPFHLQVKLLRALQEGEVMAVGATQPRKVNVRVICATNKNLEEEVAAGRFREDLYYRINTFPISLPPLRERPDDIELLARHFLRMYQRETKKYGNDFSPSCIQELRRSPFPGNVRHLKNEIQRALLMVEPNEPIEIRHFSPMISKPGVNGKEEKIVFNGRSLKEVLDAYEIRVIRRALENNNWNRSKTAQILGISRQAFMAKLSKFKITPDD